MIKSESRDMVICIVVIVILAILMFLIAWFCIWSTAKLTTADAENYYVKQTAFTSKFKEVGEKLLKIEGEVRAQVELANEFYKERADKAGYPHIYDKGDYSILVHEVTNGKYVSDLYGKYRLAKDKE